MRQIEKIIFVLGMHRSGTSAVTRLLNILGVDLGSNLLEAQKGINEAGFWENEEVVEINERILKAIDSTWFDIRKLPGNWWKREEVQGFCSKIINILKRDFQNWDLIALKDPRLCRLLPLWLDTIESETAYVGCVLVVRNPLEVVRSLTKRDSLDSGTVLCLWLAYVLESEFNSRGFPRSIVAYDDVLKDWRIVATRVANEMDIKWPKSANEVEKKIVEDISPDLRNHWFSTEDRDGLDELALKALEVYDKITTNALTDNQEYLDKVRKEFYETELANSFLSVILHQTNQLLVDMTQRHMYLGGRHHRALKVIDERDRQIEEKNRQLDKLDEIRSHWTWRIVWRLMDKGL